MFTAKQKIWLLILFVVVITVAFTTVTIATLTDQVSIPSEGSITAIGVSVYWEPTCVNKVSFINWGNIRIGESTSVTVYIKNEGTTQVRLHMEAVNWQPANAENYIALTWNRENYVLNEDSVVSATLTLSVSSTITGIDNFSFDILIEGTETS